MKKLILVLAIVMVSTWAYGARLVCDAPDPEQQVTSYEVFQDGVSLGIVPAPLDYDLSGVTPGQYEFTATAINAWGVSQPSDPYLSPAGVNAPSGLTMAP